MRKNNKKLTREKSKQSNQITKTFTLMKSLFFILILSGLSGAVLGQNIDENGRTPAQQAARATVAAVKPLLEESDKTATQTKIQYNLSNDATNAEVIIFHPSRDIVLKTIPLTDKQGSITLSVKEFEVKGVVLGIYANKKLLGTHQVRF